MLANAFQLVGAACLVLFCFAIWPPLALGAAGLFFGAVGIALESGK